MAEDYTDDIKELKDFLLKSSMPRVQRLLREEIANLEKSQQAVELKHKDRIAEIRENQDSPSPKKAVVAQKPAARQPQYSPLSSFSWDQDADSIKIYIYEEGLHEEQVEANFAEDSFELKIHKENSCNLRCAVPELSRSIVPGKSKVLVKHKRLTVILKKAAPGTWLDLAKKEVTFKPKTDDPMAGIMDIMKNMYEEGDDEMKKMIAKSWTEVRAQGSRKED